MEINNINDIKKNFKGLDFLHINDGTDDQQEVVVLNNFFLDIRKAEDFICFETIDDELDDFRNLCERKMENSLCDYQGNINLLLLDKKINLKILQRVVEELEYFKKHVETRFFRTLSVQDLNRYYQIFQATLFFEVNFFIRITKEKIEEIKEINELKFRIFKDVSTFDKFEKYIKTYISQDNFYPEFSFLFQKLIDDDLIFEKNHKNFASYLSDNCFINSVQYDHFINKSGWTTLSKSTTTLRESNFDKIFNED